MNTTDGSTCLTTFVTRPSRLAGVSDALLVDDDVHCRPASRTSVDPRTATSARRTTAPGWRGAPGGGSHRAAVARTPGIAGGATLAWRSCADARARFSLPARTCWTRLVGGRRWRR